MASLRSIAGTWILDWREGGRRHRQPIGRVDTLTERDARRILTAKQLELSAGIRMLNVASAPQFGTYAAEYLAWHQLEHPASHDRVRQIVEQHLLPEFEFSRLDDIRPRGVEGWKQRRAGQVKAATVGKELRTLKAMLTRAVAWEHLPRNPIEHVAEPRSLDSKPPRFYTAAELATLYAACSVRVNAGEGPQPNPVHASMWRLLANTGLRRAEAQALRRSWIGQDSMRILSTTEARTKSGHWREIPLTDGARAALDELPTTGDLVLPGMTPPSFSRAFARDARRAQLDGGVHCLRHTYISHLVMAGVPLRTVQVLAGHSTIAVTERYAHLTPGHLAEAGKRISL